MASGWSCAAALRASFNRREYCRLVNMASTLVAPPSSVRGMTELDRSKFTTSTEVPALRIGAVKTHKIIPVLKKYLLKVQKFKPVQNLDEDNKVVYLDPGKIQRFKDIGETDQRILEENNVTEIINARITLGYENWRYDEIFKAVLPQGVEAPNAYSKVGHLVHLNLRENVLPHKKFIGEVLLDKVAQTRTVVNKLNTIDSTYRHFAMEVIAGENDTMTTVSENSCRYKFDFAKVYWNPRLSTEHETLVSFLKSGDILYDVFAGVGPFAIPAARKGCRVLANDLNPESFKWLRENVRMNKIQRDFEAFNKDGRDFLRGDVKRDILQRRSQGAAGREHIAMNLPALATEFLDVFQDWLTPEEAVKVVEKPPTVHLYCFVKLGKDEDPAKLSKLVIEDKLGSVLTDESLVDIHNVRNVSPNKEMMREKMGKMGKNKPPIHKTKNVFKVAGARSLKHKAKAQKVSTELKKLNLKPGEKRSSSASPLKGEKTTATAAEVDKQLVELRKEVFQPKAAKIRKETKNKKNQKPKQKLNPNTRMATRAQTEAAANLVEGMQI